MATPNHHHQARYGGGGFAENHLDMECHGDGGENDQEDEEDDGLNSSDMERLEMPLETCLEEGPHLGSHVQFGGAHHHHHQQPHFGGLPNHLPMQAPIPECLSSGRGRRRRNVRSTPKTYLDMESGRLCQDSAPFPPPPPRGRSRGGGRGRRAAATAPASAAAASASAAASAATSGADVDGREEKLQKQREYYQRKREERIAKQAEYYRKNRERMIQRQSEYYYQNRDEKLKKQLEYYYTNQEEKKQKQKEYYQNKKKKGCNGEAKSDYEVLIDKQQSE